MILELLIVKLRLLWSAGVDANMEPFTFSTVLIVKKLLSYSIIYISI